MSWDYTHAKYYNDNGTVDRKKEVESVISDDYRILKSAIVGGTYYGAAENIHNNEVIGIVALTHVCSHDYFNFGMKLMDETYGPYEAKCPMSILKLLTSTDNQFAEDWRNRCVAYHESRRS